MKNTKFINFSYLICARSSAWWFSRNASSCKQPELFYQMKIASAYCDDVSFIKLQLIRVSRMKFIQGFVVILLWYSHRFKEICIEWKSSLLVGIFYKEVYRYSISSGHLILKMCHSSYTHTCTIATNETFLDYATCVYMSFWMKF